MAIEGVILILPRCAQQGRRLLSHRSRSLEDQYSIALGMYCKCKCIIISRIMLQYNTCDLINLWFGGCSEMQRCRCMRDLAPEMQGRPETTRSC